MLRDTPIAAPQDSAGLLSAPYRAATLGMLTLISLMAFEALAVATAMPVVAASLDGLRLYALAFGGTLAASVVGIVLAGRWCDARGPAEPLQAGVAVFVLGLFLAGFAPSMPVLVAGRVVQGFGGGAISVALYVVVAQLYPDSLRPRIFAAFSAAWVLPSLIGPGLSGVIVQQLGWRWVFLAVPALALPAALMLRPALAHCRRPEPPAQPRPRLLLWAVLAASGTAALHLAGQRSGAESVLLLGSGAAALLFGAWRILPAGTLRAARGLPSVFVLRGVASATFFGAEAFIPLMLQQLRGFSPLMAGLGLTVGALGWSSGAWYQGRRDQPWSRLALLRIGMALMTLGTALQTVSVFVPATATLSIGGWTLTGLGMGLVYPSLSLLTLRLSPEHRQGENASALQLCDSLAIASVLALGGAIFAALYDSAPVWAFGWVFATSLLLTLVGQWLAGRVGSVRSG